MEHRSLTPLQVMIRFSPLAGPDLGPFLASLESRIVAFRLPPCLNAGEGSVSRTT
jgi:hypothetical protein